jgi:hypothetical protein
MSVVVPFKRSRPETCLSDFMLDQMLASELAKDSEREVRKHLFGCVECTARLEALRKGREEFLAVAGAHLSLVRAETPVPVAPRVRRWWTSPIFGGAIAAGAVLFGVMLSFPLRDVDTTRTKGVNHRLGFYVKHETEVRRGDDGEIVEPGDSLRFTYSLESPKHLAIISVDSAKKASVYYPEGQVTSSMPAGQDLALPLAALLDDTLGKEQIYGLFCEDRLTVENVRKSFEAGGVNVPKGCELEKIAIEKR